MVTTNRFLIFTLYLAINGANFSFYPYLHQFSEKYHKQRLFHFISTFYFILLSIRPRKEHDMSLKLILTDINLRDSEQIDLIEHEIHYETDQRKKDSLRLNQFKLHLLIHGQFNSGISKKSFRSIRKNYIGPISIQPSSCLAHMAIEG